jgi:hypothetical protein
MRGPTTRPRRRWWLGGLALAGTWLAACVVLMAGAAADVRAGTAAIRRAQAGLELVDLATGRPAAEVGEAKIRFEQAQRRVTSPVLLPVRLVPVIGRQLESVIALVGAATEVSDTVLTTTRQAQRLLEVQPTSGPSRVELVHALGTLSGDAGRRVAAVDLGPGIGLFDRLAHERDKLSTELTRLQERLDQASAGAAAVAGMLTGHHRYLVFAANNAEMRAGAGMLLSVGELEVDDGELRLGEMLAVTNVPVPKGAVELEGDLADRWGWLAPNVEWRNLMTSPRFDEAAPLAARMWVAAGHRPVDGVVALDPVALRSLLRATGPVTVEGRRVGAENVVDLLLHGQYVRFDDRSDRKEELGQIARATVEALDARHPSLPSLARSLHEAASGRHLLVWSREPVQQAGWRALGVDGALGPDSLLLSVVNRAANKLDQFLEVSADMSFAPQGRDTEVTVRVTLRNATPNGEPRYVAGGDPASGVPAGVYLGILSVNVPGASFGLRVDGRQDFAVAGEDGPTQVVGFQLRLDQGQTRTEVVRFTLPGGHGAVRVEPSARVPAIAWTGPAGAWPDGAAHEVPFAAT